MMQAAIKLSEEEFGTGSREVGQVLQKLGLLYMDLKDFDKTIFYLQSALKIYVNQKDSDDYQRLRLKIDLIHAKVKIVIENELNEKKNKKLKEDEENRRREDLHLQREKTLLKTT